MLTRRCRRWRLSISTQVLKSKGVAAVGDIFHQQHILAADGKFDVLAHRAAAGGAGGAAVAGDPDEVDGQWQFNAAHQVGGKKKGAVQNGKDQQILAGIVAGQPAAEFPYPVADLFRREEKRGVLHWRIRVFMVCGLTGIITGCQKLSTDLWGQALIPEEKC